MSFERTFENDVSIVLAGEAGQGIQTIETILARILKRAGLYVFGTKEYMSRVRGGTNSTEIRVASRPVTAFVDRIDLCVPLDDKALPYLERRLSEKTLIVGEQQALKSSREILDVPFTKIATEIGNAIFANTVAAGFLAGLFNVDAAIILEVITRIFSRKGDEVLEKNRQAAQRGIDLAREACAKYAINVDIRKNPVVVGQVMMSGHDAVALGAAAGGCNFVASYPMSPSTGVLTLLAQHAAELGIVVEQAEDEIAAMNMGLGSWYAGGRAMVTTSGGGFALMVEGLSLAGCIESPMVIHLAQRPGPATGLPTRTEQGDLELALHAGHGEFPRIIFAPGTLQDAFICTAKAFYLADKYQVPVFILTDQFLLDSYYNISEFPECPKEIEHFIIKTTSDYKRYARAQNGISPRGIPGFGEGIVCVDSDEHDEGGYITEDNKVRTAMVNKRLKKISDLGEDAMDLELYRGKDFKKLVIGWGSTFHTILEALHRRGKSDEEAFLFLTQVYPLPDLLIDYLRKAKKVVCIENNATGQLAKLIRRETGFEVHRKILKYSGLPFTVEELVQNI
ncbi:MAG: 2-oxoacid:acceptor oxidoreductase subunit alpha [Candidatus Omnitrophota bacterium]